MSSLRRKFSGGDRATDPDLGPDTGTGLGASDRPGAPTNRDYGVHPWVLDTGEAYAGVGLPIPEPVMFGAAPSPAFDGAQDMRLRTMAVANQYAGDKMREQNRERLYELGTIVGHEGDDFQNPYVWTARGVLAYPTEHGTQLQAGTFGDRRAANPAEVALNIRATAGILAV